MRQWRRHGVLASSPTSSSAGSALTVCASALSAIIYFLNSEGIRQYLSMLARAARAVLRILT